MRRRSGRGRYDRATIHAILDEGLVGHVGIASDDQPYVIPVLYARDGEQIYLHGSPLSRLLRNLASGGPMCLTVTLLDGLVLARSAFHHSMNYRSVVVLGEGRAVCDRGEKSEALRLLVDRIVPGRSAHARGPSANELKATEVVVLPIAEASAKIRSGPPADAAADHELPVWAGVVPLGLSIGIPEPDEHCSVPAPAYVSGWTRGS